MSSQHFGHPSVSRRRLLGWGVGAAALVTGASLLPHDEAGAAPAPVGAPRNPQAPSPGRAPAPAHTVRSLLASAPASAVALTIDDGPHPVWTPRMLSLLRANGVRATFSLVGVHAHAYPDLVRRIVGEGHALCNHSMTHPQPFATRSAARINREIADAQSAIVDAAGRPPRLFRAPGGSWSPTVLSTADRLGLVPVAWDVDPRDWARPGTGAVTTRLLAARAGDILLCHDGGGDRAQTLAALATVLPSLHRRGLTFVTL